MTKDKDRTPVAQNVVTMCTKCEMELNHVVVAHDAMGIVERVKVPYLWKASNKYRSYKKKGNQENLQKIAGTQEVDLTKSFAKLADKFKDKKPLSYSMSGSFKNDDVIDHKTFGMGFVISASRDKMEVPSLTDPHPRLQQVNHSLT